MSKTLQQTYRGLSSSMSELEARIILEERAGVSWSEIISSPNKELNEVTLSQIQADAEMFCSGKPLSRIYGKREFWGLEFIIDEHTLDPRPDSETLIEVTLAYFKDRPAPKNILDLGTGSGCLLLALLSEFKNAQGIGIDISEGAVKAAQHNAKSLGMTSRATFQEGEWAKNLDQKFDLIISNPPYIASKVIPNLEKNVKNHDPMNALDGGNDGLRAYKEIFADLSRLLNDDGMTVFEIGFDQADDITRLSKEYEIRLGDIYPDLSGNPRAVEMFKK